MTEAIRSLTVKLHPDHGLKNSIRISPDGTHAVLEISEDRVALNFPDGRPLLEAHADGSISIRGEPAPTHNQAVYEAFQLWLEQALGQILHLHGHQVTGTLDDRAEALRKELHGQQRLVLVADLDSR